MDVQVTSVATPLFGYYLALNVGIVVIAVFAALSWRAAGPGQELWLATAGLILVVAVIEASYMMAYRDGLTELPSRRALNEALPRLSGQFTVAMVDVDHFKRFNDTYGHDAGDHVLRLVAARLAAALESNREAYSHYERASAFVDRLPLPEQAGVLEELATAAYLVVRLDVALPADELRAWADRVFEGVWVGPPKFSPEEVELLPAYERRLAELWNRIRGVPSLLRFFVVHFGPILFLHCHEPRE